MSDQWKVDLVTLIVVQRADSAVPIAQWDWDAILRNTGHIVPGDRVKVVDERYIADIVNDYFRLRDELLALKLREAGGEVG